MIGRQTIRYNQISKQVVFNWCLFGTDVFCTTQCGAIYAWSSPRFVIESWMSFLAPNTSVSIPSLENIVANWNSVNEWYWNDKDKGTNRNGANKGKGSPYSITECRIPELIQVSDSQPAGDVSHKPGCHYFPPGPWLPSRPLRGLLPVSLLGEWRHDGCMGEQFA